MSCDSVYTSIQQNRHGKNLVLSTRHHNTTQRKGTQHNTTLHHTTPHHTTPHHTTTSSKRSVYLCPSYKPNPHTSDCLFINAVTSMSTYVVVFVLYIMTIFFASCFSQITPNKATTLCMFFVYRAWVWFIVINSNQTDGRIYRNLFKSTQGTAGLGALKPAVNVC